jgi:hypothetical protein
VPLSRSHPAARARRPKLPELPPAVRDAVSGRALLPGGGGLLLWEFEELVGRLALAKLAADEGMTDAMKVNDLCQLLAASPGARRERPRGAPGPLLLSSPIDCDYEAPHDGDPALVPVPPDAEARANAARVAAVGALLKVPPPPAKAAGGDKKGGDKKGGKKKK